MGLFVAYRHNPEGRKSFSVLFRVQNHALKPRLSKKPSQHTVPHADHKLPEWAQRRGCIPA